MADTQISDLDATNTAALKAKVGAASHELMLYLNANQSIPNTTSTDLSWTAEETDTGGIFTPTAAFVTVPTGATGCRGVLHVIFAHSATSARYCVCEERLSDGTTLVKVLGQHQVGANATVLNTMLAAPFMWRPVTAANRIYARVVQTSGGALNAIGSAITTADAPTRLSLEFR